MDLSLSKPQEMVKDREAWSATVYLYFIILKNGNLSSQGSSLMPYIIASKEIIDT